MALACKVLVDYDFYHIGQTVHVLAILECSSPIRLTYIEAEARGEEELFQEVPPDRPVGIGSLLQTSIFWRLRETLWQYKVPRLIQPGLHELRFSLRLPANGAPPSCRLPIGDRCRITYEVEVVLHTSTRFSPPVRGVVRLAVQPPLVPPPPRMGAFVRSECGGVRVVARTQRRVYCPGEPVTVDLLELANTGAHSYGTVRLELLQVVEADGLMRQEGLGSATAAAMLPAGCVLAPVADGSGKAAGKSEPLRVEVPLRYDLQHRLVPSVEGRMVHCRHWVRVRVERGGGWRGCMSRRPARLHLPVVFAAPAHKLQRLQPWAATAAAAALAVAAGGSGSGSCTNGEDMLEHEGVLSKVVVAWQGLCEDGGEDGEDADEDFDSIGDQQQQQQQRNKQLAEHRGAMPMPSVSNKRVGCFVAASALAACGAGQRIFPAAFCRYYK